MKKAIWLFLVWVCFSKSYGQTVVTAPENSTVMLNFCTSVESVSGYCNFLNTKFITSPDSTKGRIFMEVKSKVSGPINATNLIFKIYRQDKAGAEKFETMLQQSIKPDWLYAWMPYDFDSPGKFNVKVYNESDQLICSKSFELIAFK
jgi:hypothetical protein